MELLQIPVNDAIGSDILSIELENLESLKAGFQIDSSFSKILLIEPNIKPL